MIQYSAVLWPFRDLICHGSQNSLGSRPVSSKIQRRERKRVDRLLTNRPARQS